MKLLAELKSIAREPTTAYGRIFLARSPATRGRDD